jgi:hypothetical protein
MKKYESAILFFVSITNVILLFIICHYLKLINVMLITNDRFEILIYSIIYLIISNFIILITYKSLLISKGSYKLYCLIGVGDYLLFIIFLFIVGDFDISKVINELFFTFLVTICNTFFICYSIYYKNLLKYKG